LTFYLFVFRLFYGEFFLYVSPRVCVQFLVPQLSPLFSTNIISTSLTSQNQHFVDFKWFLSQKTFIIFSREFLLLFLSSQ
jgi:hypothetical protein